MAGLKTVTYANISPKMIIPRDTAEKEEEGEKKKKENMT